jgi:hypothetical protein
VQKRRVVSKEAVKETIMQKDEAIALEKAKAMHKRGEKVVRSVVLQTSKCFQMWMP